MAESLFKTLEAEAFRAGIVPRTKESREWFRNKLRSLKSISRQGLLRDPSVEKVVRPRIGDMYMFFYDPKLREKLPYYDAFPLIILADKAPNGFYGINLHYLPMKLRAKFLDALMDTTDSRLTETSRFNVRYDIIKSVRRLRYFKPCYHRYLTSHVDSKIVKIDPPDWEIATFLPVHQFQKATASQVWRESREKLL